MNKMIKTPPSSPKKSNLFSPPPLLRKKLKKLPESEYRGLGTLAILPHRVIANILRFVGCEYFINVWLASRDFERVFVFKKLPRLNLFDESHDLLTLPVEIELGIIYRQIQLIY